LLPPNRQKNLAEALAVLEAEHSLQLARFATLAWPSLLASRLKLRSQAARLNKP
jgi:hypothetical protein